MVHENRRKFHRTWRKSPLFASSRAKTRREPDAGIPSGATSGGSLVATAVSRAPLALCLTLRCVSSTRPLTRRLQVRILCSATLVFGDCKSVSAQSNQESTCMKQSSLTTGVVQGMILTFQQDGGEVTAEIGSAAWFRWLEQATSFTFRDDAGHFTAHKTHAGNQRGGSYWRATRRSQRRLASYYLGASAGLTAEHLRLAAHALSAGAGADHLERGEASTMPHDRLALPARPVQ